MNCLPNFSFAPNQPCVVLPLADLHLTVSEANLHLPHLCHTEGANVQTAVVCSIAVMMMIAKHCDGGYWGGVCAISSYRLILSAFIRIFFAFNFEIFLIFIWNWYVNYLFDGDCPVSDLLFNQEVNKKSVRR